MKQSQAWKALEREAARGLGGKRVHRGADFGVSDVDVTVDDFPEWAIDCKYRSSKFSHHTLLSEIEKKYCGEGRTTPVLVTKHRGGRGAVVSMRLSDFADLVEQLRVENEDGVR